MTEKQTNKENIFQRYSRYKKEKKAKQKTPETFLEWLISWIKTIVFALVFIMFLHGLLIGSFIVPTGSMENTVMAGDFLICNRLFGPTTPQIIPFLNIPLPYLNLPALKDPHKGDVIVFVFPGMRDEVEAGEFTYYLKRCVAEPGDTLEVRDNVLYVNGIKQPLAPDAQFEPVGIEHPQEQFITFPVSKKWTHRNYGPIVIPKKGDTVTIDSYEKYVDWDIFIQREGHEVGWNNETKMFYLDSNAPSQKYVVEQDYYFGMGDNRDNSLDSRYWGFIPRENIIGSPLFVWMSISMTDEYGQPLSLFGKIAGMRPSRIGTIIR